MVIAGAGAYFGSGNLTFYGLNGGNTEIGVFANGSHAITAGVLFDGWWKEAVPVSNADIASAVRYQKRLLKNRGQSVDYEAQPGHRPPQPKPQVPQVWIKSMHYRDGKWTIDPGEDSWISDPGKRDAQGKRILRKDREPAGKPGYKVGDQLCLYFATVMKV
jgi:hypothetical protein